MDASFRGEAAAPSRGNDVMLGRFTFRLVHRVFVGDRGLTLHVFGPHHGREEEVLRFDCFDRQPHYHLGWSYRAEPFVEMTAIDPLAWTLVDEMCSPSAPGPRRKKHMPKIDVSNIPVRIGVGYPEPFNDACAGRTRRRLGDAGGLQAFGVNLMTLPPGKWSSQRHWHSHEDEFIYVLEGELTLVEDDGETVLRAGDAAAFPHASGNGHHLKNHTKSLAVYLEVGSRHPDDLTTCSDVDMMSSNRDGRFVHKDGTPYL